MTFFSRLNLRKIAMIGIVAFASLFVSYFFTQTPTAQANTYAGSTNGSTTNSDEIEIHYITNTSNETLRLDLLGPWNLQAVWTNLSDSASPSVSNVITNPVLVQSTSANIAVRLAGHNWPAGTKVKLQIRAIAGSTTSNLIGIENTETSEGLTSNSRMFEVVSLGSFPGFRSLAKAFMGTEAQLRISAQLPPTVTDLSYTFANRTDDFSGGFSGQLSGWDTTSVTNMRGLFFRNFDFNSAIGNWDVSNVTNMFEMFSQASRFNQDLTNWDVSKVITMTSMFAYATNFNNGDQTVSNVIAGTKPLSWTTSSLTQIGAMFRKAVAFNQNLNSFDVSKIATLQQVFLDATNFNNGDSSLAFDGDTSSSDVRLLWTVSAASNMDSMFEGAANFNQSLNSWDTSTVSSMLKTFKNATKFNNGDSALAFNGDTSSSDVRMLWTVSALTTLESTFELASNFNQDLSSWNTSRVTSLLSTFLSATRFNNGDSPLAFSGDTTSSNVRMPWTVSAVTTMQGTFHSATNFNQELNSWNLTRLVSMNSTFKGATNFNNGDHRRAFSGDTVSSDVRMTWSTPSLSSLVETFYGATSFNQDLNSWNTPSLNTINMTFQLASIFNNGDPVGAFEGDARGSDVRMTWDTTKVQFATSTFQDTPVFNQNLNSWTLSALTILNSTFKNAAAFNNGDRVDAYWGDPFNSDVTMTWDTSKVTEMLNLFDSASVFNQDLNSWNTSRVTKFGSAFLSAVDFNNGDRIGSYEGDPSNSNVVMTWNTSSVSDMASMFSRAIGFNQNIGSWTTSNVTSLELVVGASVTTSSPYLFNNGASSQSSNVMNWDTSKVTTLKQAFSNLPYFNANISSWNIGSVTSLQSVFLGASRFDQNIGGWNTSKVKDFSGVFNGAISFNEDLSNWSLASAETIQGMFAEARSMGDSPKNWDITGVTVSATAFSDLFASSATTTSRRLDPAVIRSIMYSWSFQKVPMSKTTGYFFSPLYTNCQEWSGIQRLRARWTFNPSSATSVPTAPTCQAVNLTWAPISSITFSNGVVTPSTQATTTGPSGVRYATYLSGTSKCRVDETTGLITHTASGSCEVMAYDAAADTNTALTSSYKIVTFSLPNVTVIPTPGAPVITTVSKTVSAVVVSFNRPIRSGTSTISAYEVGYALTQNGTPTWVSASPMATSSPSMSFTVSGLVNGTSYWMSVRAINSSGSGDISVAVGPVTPATTPSAPGMSSFDRASSQITINVSAPLTDGGSTILSYQYRVATSSGALANATWVNTGSTASAIAVTGLTSGQSYFFQVRAVNDMGAGAESSASTGVNLTTTSSPPVIIKSAKAGGANFGTVEFLPPTSDGGAAITSYEVRLSTNEGDTWTSWGEIATTFDANSGTRTATISGLVTSTYYTFQVRARNNVGYSDLSPQAPSGAEITGVVFGNAAATVSFKAAKFDGLSTILGYEYSLRQGPIDNPTVIGAWTSISPSVWATATPTTAASFTVSGLTNGAIYSVWVRAVNAIGGGTTTYHKWFNNTGVPNKPTPALSFNYGVSAISYSPNASYSPSVTAVSDGAFSYTTSTPAICSVDGSTGRISGLNAGTCLVTLSQAEGTNHQVATASTQVRIDPANQASLSVSASATSSPFGSTVTLSSIGGSGNGTVTFSAVVTSTCVVVGNVVTLGNAGTFCAVIAAKAGDGNYLAATSVQLSISAIKIAPTLSVSYGVSAISYSPNASYSPSVTAVSDGAFSYTTSTPAICGVNSSSGRISGLNAGTCQVTLNQAEGTNHLAISASTQVRIDPSNQPTLTVSASATNSPFGSTVTLSSTGGAGSGSVTFTTVVSSTCSIAGNVVTLGNAGSFCAVIATKATDGNYLAASSSQISISTTKIVPALSFTYGINAISYSQNASYSPSATTISDGALSYTTSTPAVCSVDGSTGRISSLNGGTCRITLNQAEGTNHLATSASAQLRIDPANQPNLTVSASATTSPYRSTVTLTASGGAGSGTVTFTPVTTSTCVVAGNVVTLGNAGSFCAVIASKGGDGNYLAVSSTQLSISTTKIAQATVSFSNLAEMAAYSSLNVFATGGSGEGVLRYRVSSQGTTGCVLAGTTLTANSSGQCTIEASRATSTNYLVSASVSQVIEVVKAAQTLRFTTNVPNEPLTGTSYSPSATASSGLSISFSVTGQGCSISGGVVSFSAAGDCIVSAGQAGNASYLAAVTVSQTIAVDRRNQTLTFGSSTQALISKRFGDAAFVVQANSTEQSATVSFTLSAQTTNQACSVFASGLVIVQNVGDCVIEAFSPQTSALAAASTISKVVAVLPDNASAPFITSVAMGNLSITAGFTPPSYIGGSTVSGYTIVAIDQTPNNTVEVSDSSCGTTMVNGQISCRINGLENGKAYKIKVAAINGAGIGEYSALSPAITVATNPAAVQNLRVVQGPTTLAISWDDPDSLGGGTFSAYRVFVKRSASSSYDVNHYFNVTSPSSRSITISAETPPDGMTHPGGPALVNGVAYDIKVVTVTTANTEELTGNTAVVNQIPRTTPEPPRLANALVVGNKLVLTWTAPISDGGAAVTTYSATVGNTPCVFAQPNDTYCEIALPTAPGNYVFSVAAQNVAGSSPEIQGVFTIAGYNSPGPQTSGGDVVTEPAKPSESAPIVSSASFSADGKQIFIRGSFLKGISKVVIGGLEARIVSQTSEMIILTAPALSAGSHTVLIHLTDKTVLRYEKNLVVKGAKPVVVVKKTATLTGFKPGSSVLSAQMKASLLKMFKANKGSKSLQCIGHTQGPTILKSDARLAMKRANAVCDFAKRNGVKVVSASYQNNKLVGAKFRRVDLVFTK